MPNDFTAVKAPDGKTINFPASMSRDDITSAMQKLYPPTQAAPTKVSLGQPITPQPGEDFAATMSRAVQAGKSVTPEQLAQSAHEGIKKLPTVIAASLLAGPAILGVGATLPEQASAAIGGGVAGGAAAGAVGGAGTEIINKGLQAAGGQNPLTVQSAKDVGGATLTGAAFGAGLGLLEKIAGAVFGSKLARGAINASAGATTRDVTYGNPAVAILDNKINAVTTGDLEAYKNALRAGAQPDQAAIAAGGRFSQVQQKINEFSPQVDAALSKSTATLKTTDLIDKPLNAALNDVISNRAMTTAEKDAATAQIGALQQSLKEGLGPTVTPLQANQIKQALDTRINWAGNVAIGDEVKPAYRAVRTNIKDMVNKAVPEVASVNENLTNLLAAKTDLQKLMQSEEVGMGKGALGAAVTGVARRLESVAGRAIPGIASAAATGLGSPAVQSGGASIAEQLLSKGRLVPQKPQI